MTRLVHIVDDTTLGGVTRTVALLGQGLGPRVAQMVHAVGSDASAADVPTADIVCLHLSSSWSRLPLLAGLRRRRATRIAIVEHTYTAAFEAVEVASRLRFRTMLRVAYGLAHKVVAVSEAQSRWMRAARLVAASRLVVIRPASDCARLETLSLPERAPGPLRLGAMGRLSREKGFDLAIAAVRLLPHDAVRLEIAGDGPDRQALEQAAAGRRDIAFLGSVTDHARWYAGLDAVVVPSRRESFGLVALEARTAARPVIAAAVDGLPEQITGESGILVPPECPSALADAIRTMANANIGARGRAARASAEGHLERTLSGWRSLVASLDPERQREVDGASEPAGAAGIRG